MNNELTNPEYLQMLCGSYEVTLSNSEEFEPFSIALYNGKYLGVSTSEKGPYLLSSESTAVFIFKDAGWEFSFKLNAEGNIDKVGVKEGEKVLGEAVVHK